MRTICEEAKMMMMNDATRSLSFYTLDYSREVPALLRVLGNRHGDTWSEFVFDKRFFCENDGNAVAHFVIQIKSLELLGCETVLSSVGLHISAMTLIWCMFHFEFTVELAKTCKNLQQNLANAVENASLILLFSSKAPQALTVALIAPQLLVGVCGAHQH